jgi:integrase
MGDRNVTTITRDDCKRYLFSQPGWNPTTIKSNATVIVCFFNWLVSNGYLKANPASKIELPKGARNTRVKVMSVSDARSLLQWALNNPFYKSCVFNLALVLFAGVRVEESTRLNWGDVDLENGLVTIGDEVAKIDGQRRVNRIPPNAIAWLRAIQGETLPGAMFLHRARMIRKESKATYPKNAARHCFASYHLAVNTPEETAKLLGHPNARLLFSTYNNFAKPDQGKEFFAIIP